MNDDDNDKDWLPSDHFWEVYWMFFCFAAFVAILTLLAYHR